MKYQNYKGFLINKRTGMDSKRRSVRGYAVFHAFLGRQNFPTLTEAKAWIDSRVAA